MGISRDAGAGVSCFQNLKNLDVSEVVQEFPSVTEEEVRSVLDFVARSADPLTPS